MEGESHGFAKKKLRDSLSKLVRGRTWDHLGRSHPAQNSPENIPTVSLEAIPKLGTGGWSSLQHFYNLRKQKQLTFLLSKRAREGRPGKGPRGQ